MRIAVFGIACCLISLPTTGLAQTRWKAHDLPITDLNASPQITNGGTALFGYRDSSGNYQARTFSPSRGLQTYPVYGAPLQDTGDKLYYYNYIDQGQSVQIREYDKVTGQISDYYNVPPGAQYDSRINELTMNSFGAIKWGTSWGGGSETKVRHPNGQIFTTGVNDSDRNIDDLQDNNTFVLKDYNDMIDGFYPVTGYSKPDSIMRLTSTGFEMVTDTDPLGGQMFSIISRSNSGYVLAGVGYGTLQNSIYGWQWSGGTSAHLFNTQTGFSRQFSLYGSFGEVVAISYNGGLIRKNLENNRYFFQERDGTTSSDIRYLIDGITPTNLYSARFDASGNFVARAQLPDGSNRWTYYEAVPEPGTLVTIGLSAVAFLRKRKARKS